MNKKIFIALALFALSTTSLLAQMPTTANDQVPSSSGFRYGTNPGYVKNGKWTDEMMASLAAGSDSLGIPGMGCNSFRISLPEHFLEKWGYTIRTKAMKHYARLGMKDLTAFIGFPSAAHQDTTRFCSKGPSKLFANMYAPIWDKGENGTPINDTNYLAAYVYKMAKTYGDGIRFWEIWNEPDFTYTSTGWQLPTAKENWWTRDPKPEELNNLLAPVQHYIRVLRVCYEVLKSIDSTDYVCIGGVGYTSFLDAVLRNTDNPTGGGVTNKYPLKGGAYFDCLSFHVYPMYNMRKWVNGGWESYRHSDRAIDEVYKSQDAFRKLLAQYGYNDTLYPRKTTIITETNLPGIAIGDYIGSAEAQRNYNMKMIVTAQKQGLKALHTFNLFDSKPAALATDPYHSMGFYENMDTTLPYKQVEKPVALACRTLSEIIAGKPYNDTATSHLALPLTTNGAAFGSGDSMVYVLWARTTTDRSETATASYTFPASLNIDSISVRQWDYDKTSKTTHFNSNTVNLGATPIAITLTHKKTDTSATSPITPIDTTKPKPIDTVLHTPTTIENNTDNKPWIQLSPNPTNDVLTIETSVKHSYGYVQIIALDGVTVMQTSNAPFPATLNAKHLAPGTYTVLVTVNGITITSRLVKE